MLKVILPNALLFQAVWWSAILAYETLGLVLWLLMFSHFIMTMENKRQDALIPVLIVFGLGTDYLMYQSGLFLFPEAGFPVWLILLWLSFPLTLTRSLMPFMNNLMVWLVFCAFFAPLAYVVGEFYDRITLTELALPVMVIQWLLIAYLSYYLLIKSTDEPTNHETAS